MQKRKIVADFALAGAAIAAPIALIGGTLGFALTTVAGFQAGWEDPAFGEKIIYACNNKPTREMSLPDHIKAKILLCGMAPGADIAVELRRPPASTVAPRPAAL